MGGTCVGETVEEMTVQASRHPGVAVLRCHERNSDADVKSFSVELCVISVSLCEIELGML